MNLCQKAPAKGLVDLHNRSFELQNMICTLLWHGGLLVRLGMEGARLFRKQMDFPEIDPSEGKAIFLKALKASLKESETRNSFLTRRFATLKENGFFLRSFIRVLFNEEDILAKRVSDAGARAQRRRALRERCKGWQW